VLATLGFAGFSTAEIKTSGKSVNVELPKDSKQRESQAKEPHGALDVGGNGGAKMSWPSGQTRTETSLGDPLGGKALSDKLLTAWKEHPEVSVLYLAPTAMVSFGDFATVLDAADEARRGLGRPARIAILVMSLDAKVESFKGTDPLADVDGGGLGFGSLGTLGKGGRSDAAAPKIRTGPTTVTGRLPPEVVQRIVRQNFGRFRLCDEQGLQRVPDLNGEIAVKFVIGADGEIAGKAAKQRATLADDATVQCVLRAFSSLSFPSPEGGIVTVVYPLLFEPPAKAAPK
jgi:hypothetical protein